MRDTRVLSTDEAGIREAAAILKAGGLVAFPTETVYGLGGDAQSDQAVAGIFAAKDRPQFNPLISHIPSLEIADELAVIEGPMRQLAEAFWPGPMTLVVPMRPGKLSHLVSAGLETVGLRVPASPVARHLIAEAGLPVAAPSANPSGRTSPTSAAHVMAGLAGRIDAVLDGGIAKVGVESTVLGIHEGEVVLLRPGGLALEAITEKTGIPVRVPESLDGPVTSPGQLLSHYATEAQIRLNADAAMSGELWLGFGDGPVAEALGVSLSPTGDLVEAAANLFAHLHTLDRQAAPGQTIAVARIPEEGLGRAINDRLRRAAAPR